MENELKNDTVTRIKQMLISIPDGELLFKDHYEELFSVNDLEILMVKLNKLKWRLKANPNISEDVKNRVNSMVKKHFERIIFENISQKDDEKKFLESSDSQIIPNFHPEYCEHTNIQLYDLMFRSTPGQLAKIYEIIELFLHSQNEETYDSYDLEFSLDMLSSECISDIKQVLMNCD